MDKFLRTIVPEVQSLLEQKRTSEAIHALEETVSWSLIQLSLIWGDKYMDLKKAEEYTNMAIKIAPASWPFHINKAHFLNLGFKFEEARDEASKAVELSGGEVYEPWYNLGVILGNLLDHEGAINAYRNAIKTARVKENQACYNISASLLATEQWKEGWEQYESRLLVFDKIKHILDRFKVPHYKPGDDAKGKKIFIYSEQGVGDLIQFMRYLPDFKEMTGAYLIFEPQIAMAKLIDDRFKIDKIAPRQDGIWPEVPPVDYVISICSMPWIFKAGKNPIPNKPYIKAPERETPDILKNKDKVKVGICWAGNGDHNNDPKRSMFLKDFLPLFDLENVQLFSFQKDMALERNWYGQSVNLLMGSDQAKNIINLREHLNDYSDTAFFVNHMDAIVTVDTSLAHIAGAMGKKTFMLIDKHNDWRWGIKGDSTAWYPSIRLFRQEKLFEWKETMQRVTDELIAFQTQQLGQS